MSKHKKFQGLKNFSKKAQNTKSSRDLNNFLKSPKHKKFQILRNFSKSPQHK
jgi:hypothetical protein